MLTKNDLQKIKQAIKDVAFTKDEAKSFATKDDLKNFATKDDLKQFATKDDLNGLATKKDLIGLARGTEIDDLKITFVDNLEKWKNELFDKIDPILNRVKTAEEENTILEARQEEREKLDRRLKKLELIHPGNRHAQI